MANNLIDQFDDAVARGDKATVERLIRDHPTGIGNYNLRGLKLAAKHNQEGLIDLFKEDAKQYMVYAIYEAVKEGHLDLAERLLPLAQNLQASEYYQRILKLVSHTGRLNLIKNLANIGQGHPGLYETILAAGASGGHLDVVEYAYENGARDNLNIALINAALNGQRDMVRYLLRLGATSYYEALEHAAKKGDLPMVVDITNLVPADRFKQHMGSIMAAMKGNHDSVVDYLMTKYNVSRDQLVNEMKKYDAFAHMWIQRYFDEREGIPTPYNPNPRARPPPPRPASPPRVTRQPSPPRPTVTRLPSPLRPASPVRVTRQPSPPRPTVTRPRPTTLAKPVPPKVKPSPHPVSPPRPKSPIRPIALAKPASPIRPKSPSRLEPKAEERDPTLCKAKTKSGDYCSRKAQTGSQFCWQHQR